jgi:membrane-bound metal-dependent hydrolase YbcI (DUF457 family)
MIFAHLIIGLILGKKFGYVLPFVLGSVLPDIDHLFVLIKNKHFRIKEIFSAMKNEEKYGERYKTPYTHSLLAWLIFSVIAYFINRPAGLAFSVGYLLHLALDILDIDEKQIFYPNKKTVKGFLPVFSKWEIIFTAIFILIYFVI